MPPLLVWKCCCLALVAVFLPGFAFGFKCPAPCTPDRLSALSPTVSLLGDAHSCYHELRDLYCAEQILLRALSHGIELKVERDGPLFANVGDMLREQGMMRQAKNLLEKSMKKMAFGPPEEYDEIGRKAIASVYFALGRTLDDDIPMLLKCTEADPKNPGYHAHIGQVLLGRGDYKGALHHFEKASELSEGGCWPEVDYNAASILERQFKDVDGAMKLLRRALAKKPDLHQAWHGLSNVYYAMGDLEKVRECARKALELSKEEAYFHTLATSYLVMKDKPSIEEGLRILNEARVLFPKSAETLTRIGNVYVGMEEGELARKYLKMALAIDPDSPGANGNIADAFRNDRMFRQALPYYKRAWDLSGHTQEHTYCNYIYALQYVSDWRGRQEHFRQLDVLLKRADKEPVTATSTPCVHPFMSIAYPLPVMTQKRVAERYGLRAKLVAKQLKWPKFSFAKHRRRLLAPPADSRTPTGRPKLRIGYIGHEFGDEIVGKYLRSVWILHDRERVEVYLYALNRSDGSRLREEAETVADGFRDLAELGSGEAAAVIHGDGIDVLVGLTGYTRGERTEIFALRPAPVQASFTGFVGTLGADFMDFFVSDKEVTPPVHQGHYTEKLALMNETYFVSDYWGTHEHVLGQIESGAFRRGDYGLPEDAVVFACFNQLYKIDPEVFEVWMRILKRVPGSVLWLIDKPHDGQENLLAEAEARGVEASRVVFLELQAAHEHLGIKALADVFLDTPLYGAHATGTDALWSGLPIVTFPRTTMVSRVASSFMKTVGLPELVVRSYEEYEEVAVGLGLDRERREAARETVARARHTSSLFKVESWVRRAEALYETMVEAKLALAAKKKRAHVFT